MSSSATPAADVATTADAAPLCFVVDRDLSTRSLVSTAIEECGGRVRHFEDVAEMRSVIGALRPDLIFLDVTFSGSDSIKLITSMDASQIACPVQIMTGLNPVLTDELRRSGERVGLRMLPVLHKPFRASAVRSVVQALGLRRDPQGIAGVTIEEILRNDWIEVWYQPKIDLKSRIMVGAEAFLRAKHPDLGVLRPDAFLPAAEEQELLDLTPRVIARVMRDWRTLAKLGVPVKFSINVPVCALKKLSIFGLLWEESTESPGWPGLIIELHEDEIVPQMSAAFAAERELQRFNVFLAIDDFGASYGELSRCKELPFAELKIDRSHVSHCDREQINLGMCRTIVDFAHRLGIETVAEGVETKGEFSSLSGIGCDMAQGHLFAKPMPPSDFAQLVLRHSRAPRRT